MTNILVPTDYSIESLSIISSVVKRFENQKINIVLFHALEMPADIQDLLFLPKEVPFEKITEDLRQACVKIKKKYAGVISQIKFRHIYGDTNGVFRNFIEANDVDIIYMPEHFELRKAYKNSVDPRPMFKKAGIPFITDYQQNVVDTQERLVPSFQPAGLAQA